MDLDYIFSIEQEVMDCVDESDLKDPTKVLDFIEILTGYERHIIDYILRMNHVALVTKGIFFS